MHSLFFALLLTLTTNAYSQKIFQHVEFNEGEKMVLDWALRGSYSWPGAKPTMEVPLVTHTYGGKKQLTGKTLSKLVSYPQLPLRRNWKTGNMEIGNIFETILDVSNLPKMLMMTSVNLTDIGNGFIQVYKTVKDEKAESVGGNDRSDYRYYMKSKFMAPNLTDFYYIDSKVRAKDLDLYHNGYFSAEPFFGDRPCLTRCLGVMVDEKNTVQVLPYAYIIATGQRIRTIYALTNKTSTWQEVPRKDVKLGPNKTSFTIEAQMLTEPKILVVVYNNRVGEEGSYLLVKLKPTTDKDQLSISYRWIDYTFNSSDRYYLSFEKKSRWELKRKRIEDDQIRPGSIILKNF